jgi:hypothetical protein
LGLVLELSVNAKLAKRLRRESLQRAAGLKVEHDVEGVPSTIVITKRLVEKHGLDAEGRRVSGHVMTRQLSWHRANSQRGIYKALKDAHAGL